MADCVASAVVECNTVIVQNTCDLRQFVAHNRCSDVPFHFESAFAKLGHWCRLSTVVRRTCALNQRRKARNAFFLSVASQFGALAARARARTIALGRSTKRIVASQHFFCERVLLALLSIHCEHIFFAKQKMSADESHTVNCPICFTDVGAEESERLDCLHEFCTACIGKWRKRGATTCPMCRGESSTLRYYLIKQPQREIVDSLMLSEFKRRFQNRFVEPFDIILNKSKIAIVFSIAKSTHNEQQLHAFFEEFACRAEPVGEHQQIDPLLQTLLTRHSNSELMQAVTPLEELPDSLLQKLRKIKNTADQRMFCDSRMRKIYEKASRDTLPMLHKLCYDTIFDEVLHDEPECSKMQTCPEEFGLEESKVAYAFVTENLPPMQILVQHGSEWMQMANNVPNADVEMVMCASNALNGQKMHENQAKSVVLANRFNPCMCACCLSLLEKNKPIMTCKKCKVTFFCSEECYLSSLMAHQRICLNSNARLSSGPFRMQIAQEAVTGSSIAVVVDAPDSSNHVH